MILLRGIAPSQYLTAHGRMERSPARFLATRVASNDGNETMFKIRNRAPHACSRAASVGMTRGAGVRRVISLLSIAVCVPMLAGASAPGFESVREAVAVLLPTAGHEVRGIVRFTPHPEGVEVQVRVAGLPQRTRHGFHVHEYGDCSAADASSAGPHYDPTSNAPGRHHHGMRPLGDLDDLRADPQGRAEVRFIARKLSIAGPSNPVLGRALVLHASFEDPSDPMSQAGDRIACGTIGVLSPQAEAVLELPKLTAGGQ
jgi:superoxide dismutase, Cu-Zn family